MPIIPNSKRTHTQLVEQGRKGGLKAQENRRKKLEHVIISRDEFTALIDDLSLITNCLINITEPDKQPYMIERQRNILKNISKRLRDKLEKEYYHKY